jgi:hypothetical protein
VNFSSIHYYNKNLHHLKDKRKHAHIRKKMFASDHARRGFTSPEGETGLSQHQDCSGSPDEAQSCNYYSEPLHGNPSFVSPVGDEQMDSKEAINSLAEGSLKDVGTNRSNTGGVFNPEYQPNACRLGNEALDGVEAAGPPRTEQSHINFPFFEPCFDLAGKVSSQGERESSVRKLEVPLFSDPKSIEGKKVLFSNSIPQTPSNTAISNCWSTLSPQKKHKVSLVPAG